jgi:superfamily II DNA or RNA helicase
MDQIIVHPYNATYDRLECSESVAATLFDYFSFTVPDFYHIKKRNPRLKNWNGKIHLFNRRNGQVYVGLRDRIENFAKEHDIELVFDKIEADTEFSLYEAQEFITSLNLTLPPRDYQTEAFVKAVRKRRLLILSPTASGKSLLLYLLVRYYHDKNVLLIVPTINLTIQMYTDFESYGWIDIMDHMHLIYGGQDLQSNKRVICSTWQSIYDQSIEYFSKFQVVLADECHLFEAKSLKGIMEKLVDCDIRFGCTGTLK